MSPALVRERFGSVSDVLARLSEPPKHGANDHSRMYADTPRTEWDFGLGYEGAYALYRDGWKDGAGQASELARTLDVTPPRVARLRFTPDVAGAFPNVPAYLAGDPESMYAATYRSIRAPKHVTLYVPLVFNGIVPAQAALNRGVAFMALIDALEDSGVRVRVEGYIATDIRGATRSKSQFLFNLKDYRDPLNLEDLIFAVAHPAMLRRIWFGLAERSPHRAVVQSTNASYGAARTITADEIGEPEGESVIFPNLSDTRAKTPAQYLADIVSTLPDSLREQVTRQEG